MVLSNEKGILLEIRECELNDLKDFVKQPEVSRKSQVHLIEWMINSKIAGYTSLEWTDPRSPADISFHLVEEQNVSGDVCSQFIEATVDFIFRNYKVDGLLFCSTKNSRSISEIFLKAFHPHPVGWVHLHHDTYILTRRQYAQTEEEFYKI